MKTKKQYNYYNNRKVKETKIINKNNFIYLAYKKNIMKMNQPRKKRQKQEEAK